MNRVTEYITRDILRAEKNVFIFRLLLAIVAYVGITLWLKVIRQVSATDNWLLWCMVGLQLFLFFTIFVVCSIRLKQCRRQRWWLGLLMIMSRVSNWEIVFIPAAAVVTLILSEINVNVSEEQQYLLPVEDEEDSPNVV